MRSLPPYPAVTEKMRIRCDANESCFSLPPSLLESVLERVAGVELGRYPDPYATECCRLMAARCGVAPEQVVAGDGSDELIGLIANCLLPRGAGLLTLAHDFSMYAQYAHLAELRHAVLPKRDDLSIDVDALIAALRREEADAVIFSNPCNPTGLLLPSAEVERLVASTGALVVVDEAYMEFAGDSVCRLIDRYQNLLVLRTCSKAVGLAGVRVGFALGNSALIGALCAAKSPYNVNALSQAVAAEVLGAPGYVEDCARRIVEQTASLREAVRRLAGEFPAELSAPGVTKTNFIYFKARDAAGIREKLRREGIAVRRMGDYLRISTGTPEENDELAAALRHILAEEEPA